MCSAARLAYAFMLRFQIDAALQKFQETGRDLLAKSLLPDKTILFCILHFCLYLAISYPIIYFRNKNVSSRKINDKQRSHEWICLTLSSIIPHFPAPNKAGIWNQWKENYCILMRSCYGFKLMQRNKSSRRQVVTYHQIRQNGYDSRSRYTMKTHLYMFVFVVKGRYYSISCFI